jgi:hypothetical protein
MSRSFSMGTRGGGVPRGDRRIPYEGVDVAGFRGVMDEATGVSVSKGGRPPLDAPEVVEIFHCGEHAGVEFQTACHGQGVADRPAVSSWRKEMLSG